MKVSDWVRVLSFGFFWRPLPLDGSPIVRRSQLLLAFRVQLCGTALVTLLHAGLQDHWP